MLTANDVALMRDLRAELASLRATPCTLKRRTQTATDPYTKEPVYTVSNEQADVIVSGFTGEVGGERLMVNGVVIQSGDVMMTFDYTTNLNGVQVVIYEGIEYVLVSVLPKGIGAHNRYECVARRAR